jgi:hypothetical protein
MPLLFDSLFSSIALGHLMVDLLNGSRSVLIASLVTTCLKETPLKPSAVEA